MKNEGPKILLIAFLIMCLLYFFGNLFSIDGNLMIAIGIIGWGVYGLGVIIKKLTFPAVFVEPDEEQRSLVNYYLQQVEKTGNSVEVKPIGLVQIAVIAFLSIFILSIGLETENFWKSLFFVFIIIAIFLTAYYISAHHNTSRFMDYKVAKVEFYDSSYIHMYSPSASMYTSAFGKSFEEYITPHYVFVRSYDGKNLKLKVPCHVHDYVCIRPFGEGYLVKYRHKRGLFDVYDFVPKYEDKRFVNR